MLSEGWDTVPYNSTSQLLGDKWFEDGQSAVLKVPSVVVPVEWNYVLNPLHPDAEKLTIF